MQTLKIEILGGPKCRYTQTTCERVLKIIDELGIEANVTRVTRAAEIAIYPLEYMPGIVIDGRLVYSSQGEVTTPYGVQLTVPAEEEIREMVRQARLTSGAGPSERT